MAQKADKYALQGPNLAQPHLVSPAGQSPSSSLAPTAHALGLLAPWARAVSLSPAQMTGPSTVSPEGRFDFLRVPPPLPLLPTPRHPAWHEEALQASQ